MKNWFKDYWREILSWITVLIWIIWTFNSFDFDDVDLLYASHDFWPAIFILLSYPILILYLLSRGGKK